MLLLKDVDGRARTASKQESKKPLRDSLSAGPAVGIDGTPRSSFLASVFWDCSNQPKSNDRLAKLGASAQGARGVAIAAFDPETNRYSFADAFGHPTFSRARLDPDYHVLLNHGGLDVVWGHRYVVDHENRADSIKHRSTIGVNQKGKMCWWYSQDLEWGVEIEEVGPPVPKGREFNGAGFLNSLYGTVSGGFRSGSGAGIVPFGRLSESSKSGATFVFPGSNFKPVETKSNMAVKAKRATRCLNVNMRGGYFTDGLHVAQLRQLFYMMPLTPPKPKKPKFKDVETESTFKSKNPGQGGAGGYGKHPGQIEDRFFSTQDQHLRDREKMNETVAMEKSGGPDSDCMVDRWMAAVRGDMLFDVGGFASAIAYTDISPPEEGDAYAGAHWLGRPDSRGPKYVPAEDVSSDQPIFETPNAERGIRVYVRIPRGTGVPPSCQLNSDIGHADGSYSSTGHAPPASAGGGADAGEWSQPVPINDNGMTKLEFTAGYLTYVKERIPTPMVSGETRLEIFVPYTLPSNLSAATAMDFRLFWKPTVASGLDFPTAWNEIAKSIGPGHNPTGPEQLRWLKFEIPSLGLRRTGGLGGGQIDLWFMRRSDDSATGKAFLLAGAIRYAFAPVGETQRRQFAGVA